MQSNNKISLEPIKDKQKKAISLTTYRALFVAKLLNIKPMTYDEIAKALSQDAFLSTSCHKDTILNTINSLREVGFNISKPKPSNNYKFELLSQPFRFKLTQTQVEILNLIRNSLYYQNNYNLIFDINNIYKKIIDYSKSDNFIDIIEHSNYLKNINKNILNQCIELCSKNATATITYESPIHGNEKLKIKAKKIVFENNRLYLWLYSYKYNLPSYLRIDKISEITSIDFEESSNVTMTNFVEYELTGNAAKKFIPKEEEIIIIKDENRIVVKSNVINKFNFFQRIISFAQECQILSPQNMREEYINHINEIIGVYQNED